MKYAKKLCRTRISIADSLRVIAMASMDIMYLKYSVMNMKYPLNHIMITNRIVPSSFQFKDSATGCKPMDAKLVPEINQRYQMYFLIILIVLDKI